MSLFRQLRSCCAVFPLLFSGAIGRCTTAPVNPTIVVLGSSTAQGVGASTYQNCWAGLLTNTLYPSGYTVRNVSIAGTNTADSLARFDQAVTPYRPGFVLLATSIVNEPAATAAQSYLSNTLLLIRKTESIGAIPIVVAPYPNNGFSLDMYSSVKAIYATLAAEGVPMLDFLDGGDDGQGHWISGLDVDGTHPNDIGHRLLFDAVPLTLFDGLRSSAPPVDPHGFGSWVQNTDLLTRGDLEVRPSSSMASWTVSFWNEPSAAAGESTVLSVNAGEIQVRRTGHTWTLWSGAAKLASLELRGPTAFHHVAVSYRATTGVLAWYVDSQLRARAVVNGLARAAIVSLGGEAGNSGRNGTGDHFADLILYRAPLDQADIVAIKAGQPSWKSVEAWLPLSYSPARPTQNLAPTSVTVIAHGTWIWSSDSVPASGKRAPVIDRTHLDPR